jgi:hypothetical protein
MVHFNKLLTEGIFMELDIVGWVKRSTDEERAFRQAVHTILFAIASSEILSTKMFMKGGILLAIEFNSTRHTKDMKKLGHLAKKFLLQS